MLTLGFDEILQQLYPRVTIESVAAQNHDASKGLGLGDFRSVWQYLESTTDEVDTPKVVVSDIDEESTCLSAKQKKQLRKRELRKRKRQAAHEAAEAAVPGLDDVPEMGDYSTATETEDVSELSDDDNHAEARLAALRATLVHATKAYQATKPFISRLKRSNADRTTSLYSKLAAQFPDEAISRHIALPSISSAAIPFKDKPALSAGAKHGKQGQTHIFIDSSNIYLGFQDKLQFLYPTSYPSHSHSLHKPQMDMHILDTILSRGRDSHVKSLVGSSPLLQNWDEATRRGYEVSILQRVSTPEHAGKREQGVDELLHLKMMESLLDSDVPATMVLATGDANVAQFSSGFFNVVLRALGRGWKVEVWAFRKSVNRLWLDRQFRQANEAAFSMHFLDDFLEELEA